MSSASYTVLLDNAQNLARTTSPTLSDSSDSDSSLLAYANELSDNSDSNDGESEGDNGNSSAIADTCA
jgi:hypothetical protein